MGSHIFLTSKENFETCLENGLCGGIAHKLERINSEVIAGFEIIRPSEFIFFYVKNVGIYGLWKATSRPFFDKEKVWKNKDQIYPYRVTFEPSIREFRKPIALSDILDLRDKGKIWTFDLANNKSHQPITTEEGKELIRLLLRNNPVYYPLKPISKPYSTGKVPLPLKLETDKKGHIKIEGYLNAWFMRSFAQSKLKDIIGEYHDFLNLVPTSFNTIMDVFLTHVTPVDGVEILHKFTCIELKTGICTEDNLNQIIKYENWLIRKLADGDSEMVQSILVGFDFEQKVLEYVLKRRQIEDKTVRLIKYEVNATNDDIILQEVGA